MNNKKMTLVLSSCPNPDFGQTEAPAPEEKVPVKSFVEASARVREYITQHNLGSGNWSGGDIFDERGDKIARISYNGRVWNKNGELLEEYYSCWGTTLDANQMSLLEQRYGLYVQLYYLAQTLRQIPDHAPPAEAVERIATDLLDAIVADMGGKPYSGANLVGSQEPLSLDELQDLISRQIGHGQPNLGDLEGYYTGQLAAGEERCVHLTFDDPETLVVDIFDAISAVLPFGKGDLIASPVYINLRTGEVWYEERSDDSLLPANPGFTGELNQAVTVLGNLLVDLSEMAEQVNLNRVITLTKQRIAEEAAIDPTAVAAWYVDVSQQAGQELQLPLDQAKRLVHVALKRLAGVADEYLNDDFPVSVPLVVLARRHGDINVPDNGRSYVELR
jgi:hypothetical protein